MYEQMPLTWLRWNHYFDRLRSLATILALYEFFSLSVLIEEKPLLSFVSAVVSQPPRATFPFQPLQLVSHCSCIDTSVFPMKIEELAKRSTLPSTETSISSKKIVIHAHKVLPSKLSFTWMDLTWMDTCNSYCKSWIKLIHVVYFFWNKKKRTKHAKKSKSTIILFCIWICGSRWIILTCF